MITLSRGTFDLHRGGLGDNLLLSNKGDILGVNVGPGLEQHDGVLDHVLQLAHVAGPVVSAEGSDGRRRPGRQRLTAVAMPLPVVRQEVVSEERDVLGARAQRRHVNRDDAQAVIQIFTQLSGGDRFVGIDIGGRDEAHVHDRIGCLAADTPDHAVLDHAQQLGLDRLGHLDQLVEKHGAAISGLEQPWFVADGSGKGTLHVAEHLGLEQRFGEGGAVDRHERPAGTPAVVMDELSNELLARAALAGNEDGGVGGRDLARQGDDLPKCRGAAQHVELLGLAGGLVELRLHRLGLARHDNRVSGSPDEDL